MTGPRAFDCFRVESNVPVPTTAFVCWLTVTCIFGFQLPALASGHLTSGTSTDRQRPTSTGYSYPELRAIRLAENCAWVCSLVRVRSPRLSRSRKADSGPGSGRPTFYNTPA